MRRRLNYWTYVNKTKFSVGPPNNMIIIYDFCVEKLANFSFKLFIFRNLYIDGKDCFPTYLITLIVLTKVENYS